MPEISTGEPESFAKKYSELRRCYGEEGEKMLADLYHQLTADESKNPENRELIVLLAKLDFAGIEYPQRTIGENTTSYIIRLYQFFSPEGTESETAHTKIAGAVAGILEE